MKKRLLKLTVLLLLAAFTGYAQDKSVSGKVSAKDGSAMPGVNVLLKGTANGTTTDADGAYKISVPSEESVLVFTFIGHTSQEIVVGNKTALDVTLDEDATQLGEVVVTALGIERERKSLTYSAQEVSGDKLNTVRDANFMNSLAGKVPGLNITRSASGAGGSVRVVLRGQKSTRDNQPLYVIDGVPIASANGAQATDIWSGRDGGDVMSTINSADIESMTVLKGASASALYGSQGQNGVILITTKRGKNGVANIDFSSSLTMEKPLYTPDLQHEYLQTAPGASQSWGAKGNSGDPVKDFFQTGKTWINSLSITAGNEKAQTYFSYSNTDNRGILPTNTLDQNTLTFRETAKLSNKFSIDGNVMLSQQKVHNRMAGGLYFNPLTGLYLFPRGLDFNQYKTFERFSSIRGYDIQNWWNIDYDANLAGDDNQQNPYWILNRNTNDMTRQNVFASLKLKYAVNSWLTFQARGNVNRITDKYEAKIYATTQGVLSDLNGRYVYQTSANTLMYGDLLLSGDRELTDKIGLSVNLGTSIRHSLTENFNIDSKGSGAGLAATNAFTLGAILPSTSMNQLDANNGSRGETQSVFATATLDFSKKVYVDATIRNDWSSTLAYTGAAKGGYLYYSGGVNAIVSDLMTLPDAISFIKVRASYAKVGNGVAEFSTLPTSTYSRGIRTPINLGLLNPDAKLKPEDSRSTEAGLEVRLFENRLTFDATIYKNNTKNQYFLINAPRGSGVSQTTINAGKIENSGIEVSLGYDIIKNPNITWNTTLNYTKNTNKIIELTPLLTTGEYPISAPGVNGYGLYIRQGGQFGDIYGKKFQREGGKIVVDPTGKPLTASPTYQFLGNPTPKALVGWNNTLTIGKISVNLLIDGRFGGKVMSISQAILDEYGVSQKTADERNAGGVDMPAVVYDATVDNGDGTLGAFTGDYTENGGLLPTQIFYNTVGGRAGITENYMYNATNVRLRELAIGYRLPIKSNVLKNVSVSLIGRNLFFITKDAPFDPEISMATNNGLQGVDTFVLPSTRSIGFSLKVGL